jgi:hypothetical protein
MINTYFASVLLLGALANVACGGSHTAAEAPIGHPPSSDAGIDDQEDSGAAPDRVADTEPSDTGSNSLSKPNDSGPAARSRGH